MSFQVGETLGGIKGINRITLAFGQMRAEIERMNKRFPDIMNTQAQYIDSWGQNIQTSATRASELIMRKFEGAFNYIQRHFFQNSEYTTFPYVNCRIRFVFDDLNTGFNKWLADGGQKQIDDIALALNVSFTNTIKLSVDSKEQPSIPMNKEYIPLNQPFIPKYQPFFPTFQYKPPEIPDKPRENVQNAVKSYMKEWHEGDKNLTAGLDTASYEGYKRGAALADIFDPAKLILGSIFGIGASVDYSIEKGKELFRNKVMAKFERKDEDSLELTNEKPYGPHLIRKVDFGVKSDIFDKYFERLGEQNKSLKVPTQEIKPYVKESFGFPNINFTDRFKPKEDKKYDFGFSNIPKVGNGVQSDFINNFLGRTGGVPKVTNIPEKSNSVKESLGFSNINFTDRFKPKVEKKYDFGLLTGGAPNLAKKPDASFITSSNVPAKVNKPIPNNSWANTFNFTINGTNLGTPELVKQLTPEVLKQLVPQLKNAIGNSAYS